MTPPSASGSESFAAYLLRASQSPEAVVADLLVTIDTLKADATRDYALIASLRAERQSWIDENDNLRRILKRVLWFATARTENAHPDDLRALAVAENATLTRTEREARLALETKKEGEG